jgi:hypothetical protein
MALRRSVAVVAGLAVAGHLLAGCDGAPATLAGTALGGKPFVVRSALLGPRYFGTTEPTRGGVLLLTDLPDYCESARRWREAQARGEPPLPPPSEYTLLNLFFSGTRLEPGTLRAGTYPVNAAAAGGYVQRPLEVLGGLLRVSAGERVSGPTVAGKVELDDETPLREGAEVSARLSLTIDLGPPGSLEGELTATYCPYL